MPSPLEIMTNAARDLTIIGSGETLPSAEDTEQVLIPHYNRMVGYLTARQLGWYDVNEKFPWGVSQQSYEIAPAGTTPAPGVFVMTAAGVRPPKFDRAKIVLTAVSPNTEIVIPIITVQIYSGIVNPTLSALYPYRIYYQPTFPNGTLWPVPFPTATGNALRLFWKNQISTITTLTMGTDLGDLAPGVEDALTWEMVRRCAPAFRRTLTQDQKDMCSSSFNILLTMKNADPVLIQTDLAGSNNDGYGSGSYSRPVRTPWW